MARTTRPPATPPATPDTDAERVYRLLTSSMVSPSTFEDAGDLLRRLDELCEHLKSDYGAEVVAQGRALWLERTRTERVTRYTPAQGYGGVC